MKNIEKFKKIHYYGDNGKELSNKEINRLGLTPEHYESLDECAYQTAYDLTEDWSKDPTSQMIQEGYKKGVEDGFNFLKNIILNHINFLKDHGDIGPAILQRIDQLIHIIEVLDEYLKEES